MCREVPLSLLNYGQSTAIDAVAEAELSERGGFVCERMIS
jgi:hypothetical protein